MFLGTLAALAWHAGHPGIATPYIDPIDKIRSQAEAMYAAGTFEIADHGIHPDDWMTPRFVGRYAIWKPPVLMWLSAIAVKAMGHNPLALRLPSMVSGAAAIALMFWWLLAQAAPLGSALTAAILLLSTHLFFTSSRIAMMDAMVTCEVAFAMYALARDPGLQSRKYLWIFGSAVGVAIMTKSLVGLLPLIILAVMLVISRERPSVLRVAQAIAIAAAIALPWHLYQLVVHHRWFIDEYILTETISYGMKSPPQDAQEPQFRFYFTHVLWLDPFLLAGAIAAVAWCRSKLPNVKLLLVWIAVVFGAALTFQYRNDAYLTPLYPALALLAASAIPKRFANAAAALAALLFICKAIAASQPWGLPFELENVNPSIAALDQYAALHRGNDLAVLNMDDDFYSACIGLPRVRYVWIDPNPPRHFPMDFPYLGVLISASQYARLPELEPEFARRLRAEGLDSTAPIATSILARTPEELGELVRTHPQVDFFLPKDWAPIDQGAHQPLSVPGDRVFLLSREKIQRP